MQEKRKVIAEGNPVIGDKYQEFMLTNKPWLLHVMVTEGRAKYWWANTQINVNERLKRFA